DQLPGAGSNPGQRVSAGRETDRRRREGARESIPFGVVDRRIAVCGRVACGVRRPWSGAGSRWSVWPRLRGEPDRPRADRWRRVYIGNCVVLNGVGCITVAVCKPVAEGAALVAGGNIDHGIEAPVTVGRKGKTSHAGNVERSVADRLPYRSAIEGDMRHG